MAIEITSYETLLQVARQEPEPQMLLFLFVRAGLPEEHTPEEARRFEEGKGGALVPVFRVGLAPEQLTTFEDLVQEADAMGAEWQLVLIAALAGTAGQPPSDEMVNQWLDAMERVVHGGGDLRQFLAFNRAGEPVHFS